MLESESGAFILPPFSVIALNPWIFDQYELRKQFTSVKSSKKSISGVNFDIWCLRNREKWGRRCHSNRFFVTVSGGVLLVMNRGYSVFSKSTFPPIPSLRLSACVTWAVPGLFTPISYAIPQIRWDLNVAWLGVLAYLSLLSGMQGVDHSQF